MLARWKFSSRYQSPGGVTSGRIAFREWSHKFSSRYQSPGGVTFVFRLLILWFFVFIPLSKSGRCHKMRDKTRAKSVFSSRYQSPGGVTHLDQNKAAMVSVFIPLSKSGRCHLTAQTKTQTKTSFHPVIKVRAVSQNHSASYTSS